MYTIEYWYYDYSNSYWTTTTQTFNLSTTPLQLPNLVWIRRDTEVELLDSLKKIEERHSKYILANKIQKAKYPEIWEEKEAKNWDPYGFPTTPEYCIIFLAKLQSMDIRNLIKPNNMNNEAWNAVEQVAREAFVRKVKELFPSTEERKQLYELLEKEFPRAGVSRG